MCHRQFVDDDGSVWAVWDVNPARIWEALGTSTPAREAAPGGGGAGRRPAAPPPHPLGAVWLCLEPAAKKLRPAPTPADWEALASTDLALLRRAATAVRAKQ